MAGGDGGEESHDAQPERKKENFSFMNVFYVTRYKKYHQ